MQLSQILLVSLLCPFGAIAKKSAGCGKQLQNDPLVFNDRKYLLHLPSHFDNAKPHPIIFAFHGRGETASKQQDISQLSDPAFNSDMIVVYPEGTKGFGDTSDKREEQTWQGDPEDKNNTLNDVSFTLSLAKNLSERYCVDSNRWYATGKSVGGGFAVNILPCDRGASQKFAAFAGIASADYTNAPGDSTCDPETVVNQCHAGKKGVPILENHGTGDKTINITGGPHKTRCLPSILHFMDEWAGRNNISSDGAPHAVEGVSGLTKYSWGSGVNVHYRKEGLGHLWPSKAGLDHDTKDNYDITTYVMQFFRDHPLK